MSHTTDEPLGLIAGGGGLPGLIARGARAAGRPVICCGLGGYVEHGLPSLVDVYRPVGLLRVGQWVRTLRRHGVREAVLVGRVSKADLYRHGRYRRWLQYRPDCRTLWLYWRTVRRDKRDAALLNAVADDLATSGIILIESTRYAADHLTTEGVLTRRVPTPAQRADIEFGWELARTIGRLDIGQALAMIDRDVIAVEAMEGTDAMIERAGRLCRTKGWTLIKVTNTVGDLRLDVPIVGVETIRRLAAAGAGCLVLEAGRTMLLDRPAVLAAADAAGIAVVGKPGV